MLLLKEFPLASIPTVSVSVRVQLGHVSSQAMRSLIEVTERNRRICMEKKICKVYYSQTIMNYYL